MPRPAAWIYTHYRLTIWVTLVLALALSLTMVNSSDARAHSRCMVDVFGNKFDCLKHRHHRQRVKRRKSPVVLAHHSAKWRQAQARLQRAERDPHCLARIRVVGTQRLGNDRAKEDAVSIWREQVRYDHGSKFADFRNAKNVKSACTQNRVGKTGGEYFFLCELSAVPCHARTREENRDYK